MNFDDAMREFRTYLVDDASVGTVTDTAPPRMARTSPLPRPRILRRATVLAVSALALAAVVVGAIAIRSTEPTRYAVGTARVAWGLDAEAWVTPEHGMSVREATDRATTDIDKLARNADIAGFRMTASDDGLIRMRFPGGEARYQVEYFLHVGGIPIVDSWRPVIRPDSGYSLRITAAAEYGVRPRQAGEPFTATAQTARMMSGPPGQRHALAPLVRVLRADTEIGPMDLIVEQRALGAVAAVTGVGEIIQGETECPTGLGAPLIGTCGIGGGGPFTAPDGTTHAAVFTAFARVAPEIARIELRSTDGRTFPGTVDNGWYLIAASVRGPLRALYRGTVVGYDADGNRIATARLSALP